MLRLRVREVAQAQGIRQIDLHYATNVNMGTIQHFWHNRNDLISLAILEKLAKALNVPPLELLEEVPEREALPA